MQYCLAAETETENSPHPSITAAFHSSLSQKPCSSNCSRKLMYGAASGMRPKTPAFAGSLRSSTNSWLPPMRPANCMPPARGLLLVLATWWRRWAWCRRVGLSRDVAIAWEEDGGRRVWSGYRFSEGVGLAILRRFER